MGKFRPIFKPSDIAEGRHENKKQEFDMKLSTFFTTMFLSLTLVVNLFAGGNDENKLDYQPVADFLKLPDGANFGQVAGVALNSKGHIFVFHRGLNPLMEFDQDGNFVRSLADGLVEKAHGLRIDREDNIWITDVENHLVIKLSPEGRVKMVLGQKGTAGEWSEKYKMVLFNKPADVAFNAQGDVFVADGYGNSRIVRMNKHGELILAWGKPGTGEGEFNLPHSIAIDKKGLVYVVDRENRRIQIFDQDGNFKKMWTNIGAPYGLFFAPAQDLFVSDGVFGHVYKFNLEGEMLGKLGTPGKRLGQFHLAHFLAVDSAESIYVAEVINFRVQKLIKK